MIQQDLLEVFMEDRITGVFGNSKESVKRSMPAGYAKVSGCLTERCPVVERGKNRGLSQHKLGFY